MVLGCKTQPNDDVMLFNKTLGTNYANVLNNLTVDFEIKLKEAYPHLTINESYNQLLIDFANDPDKDESEMLSYKTEKVEKLFIESGFKNDHYYKEGAYTYINNLGNYMKALYKIGQNDSLVHNYHNMKQNAGKRSAHFICKGVLTYKPDFDNEIYKKIIVMEFTY